MPTDSARSPRLLRRINSGAVLRFALDTGDFDAAQAMSATGLTRATVLGVCAELATAGWLEEIADSRAAGHSRPGRPARRYRLQEQAGVVVGVDAGENRQVVIVADLHGRRLVVRREATEDVASEGAERLRVVSTLIHETLAEVGRGWTDVLLTTVGVPAPVDADGLSPRGEDGFWQRMNPCFVSELEGQVVVENDANLAARAEYAHDPVRDVATLLSGERFGAGLIVDGHLLRGRHGGAGELRFLELLAPGDGLAGPADGIGALARRWARAELAAGVAARFGPSQLEAGGAEKVTAEDVFECAAQGDAFAEHILELLGRRLAQIAAVFESVLDVQRIVIAGAIAAAVEPVLVHARAVLEAEFSPPYPELVASTLGSDVIAQGAVDIALARLREEPLDFLPRGDATAQP